MRNCLIQVPFHYYLWIYPTRAFLTTFTHNLIPSLNLQQRKQYCMSSSGSKSELEKLNEEDVKSEIRQSGSEIIKCSSAPSSPIYRKNHAMTICMVPPPEYKDVWEKITKARTDMLDPGLYRWPPHANMIYPFFDILEPHLSNDHDRNNKDEIVNEKLNLLQVAIQSCKPFHISIDSFGTFGGSHRGVLYLIPRSFSDQALQDEEEPLLKLQSLLENCFPECNDQRKHGKYTPHMTLSHFPSLESALQAKEKIEQWWTKLEFKVDRVYILKRKGDEGQFKKVATLKLGEPVQTSLIKDERLTNIEIHDPPQAFPDMPIVEEEWVYNERMKLKELRNGKGNRRRKSGRRGKMKVDRGRGHSKSIDAPEEIAKKRAERALKRERLQEIALIEQAIQLSEDDCSV